MRMIILGAPGAGKGTQARAIAESFGIPAISTGEIFRSNIKQGTELGLRVKALLDSGELVPDELTNEIVADRLAQPDAQDGFLLDGYPRNLGQVEALDALLTERGAPLDVVLEMTCEEEAVIQRLLHRAEVEGRADDTEDVIRHRMEVYHAQTEPLTDAYRAQGVLVQVDGMGDVEQVAQRISGALASYRS